MGFRACQSHGSNGGFGQLLRIAKISGNSGGNAL